MSYQLRAEENLGHGVRRVFRRQIERAIEASHSKRTETSSPVHETRKHLKKARAALGLLSGAVSRKKFSRTNKKLRRVANLISDIRDAEVRFQTMQQLGHLLRIEQDGIVQEAEVFLGLELESFLAAFSDWKEEAAERLEKVRCQIKEWPADCLTCKQLRTTVQRGYCRGRKALRAANKTPTAENFHEFRKHAKELMYQLRILQPVSPPRLQPFVNELLAITEKLGNAHDLAFLEKRLFKHKGRGADDRAAGALSELIGLREKELQREAAFLGERFYAARPKEFGHRLALLFENQKGDEEEKPASRQGGNGLHAAVSTR
jgi:CHAD domain-containing protein